MHCGVPSFQDATMHPEMFDYLMDFLCLCFFRCSWQAKQGTIFSYGYQRKDRVFLAASLTSFVLECSPSEK